MGLHEEWAQTIVHNSITIEKNSLIGGANFKSGQTKMKSVLVDFLIGASIKPTTIVSYNHVENNDEMNLLMPQTFHSKEISKSNVVNDIGRIYILSIDGNNILVVKTLAYLEEALQRKSGNPDACLADYVDVAIDTGVGGLIT
ncbi:hypothetical protein SUGI_0506900 [Cryptomeria japonica]|nr:hypothetical protein SUGI_0506900 [Cryptomeria japonica]